MRQTRKEIRLEMRRNKRLQIIVKPVTAVVLALGAVVAPVMAPTLIPVVHAAGESVNITGDTIITGTVGTPIEQCKITLTLNGDTFKGIHAGDQITDWFNFSGSGINALADNDSDGVNTLSITISGIPNSWRGDELLVSIPGSSTTSGNRINSDDTSFGYYGFYLPLDQVSQPSWSGNIVNWTAVENADIYMVELYNSGTLVHIEPITDTSFDFTDVIKDTGTGSYTVKVTALGEHGIGPTSIESSVNLYTASATQFHVKFIDSMGVGTLDTQDIEVNGTISNLPNPPIHDGYEFEGWYESLGDGSVLSWDQNTPVTHKMDLVASYKFKISFDSKGGSLVSDQFLKTVDWPTITAPVPPTKPGYKFEGWQYNDGSETVDWTPETPFWEATTLVAKWIVDTTSKPAAPNVTGNDTLNTITGLATTMEFSKDGSLWTKYAGQLPDLTGNITLKVRVAANLETGAPAGDIVTIVFTATPATPETPPTSVTPTTPAPTLPVPTGIITAGTKGSAVTQLQAILGVKADGVFGAKTKAALKSWQKAHGLKADGIFGPKTQAAMTKSLTPSNGFKPTIVSTVTLKAGSTGTQVKQLQDILGVKNDGIFGPKTKAALKEWQKVHGLKADGILGPKTIAAMNK